MQHNYKKLKHSTTSTYIKTKIYRTNKNSCNINSLNKRGSCIPYSRITQDRQSTKKNVFD